MPQTNKAPGLQSASDRDEPPSPPPLQEGRSQQVGGASTAADQDKGDPDIVKSPSDPKTYRWVGFALVCVFFSVVIAEGLLLLLCACAIVWCCVAVAYRFIVLSNGLRALLISDFGRAERKRGGVSPEEEAEKEEEDEGDSGERSEEEDQQDNDCHDLDEEEEKKKKGVSSQKQVGVMRAIK